jgi:hypothetical protein
MLLWTILNNSPKSSSAVSSPVSANRTLGQGIIYSLPEVLVDEPGNRVNLPTRKHPDEDQDASRALLQGT